MANPWAGILSGAGQGIMAFNDWHTADKRDKIMAQLIKRRAAQQAEIDARLMEDISEMRGETPEEERAQAMGEFMEAFKMNRANIGSTASAGVGAVSDREAAMLKEAAAGVGAYGNREADITSRIVAPGRMRQEQDLRLGRTQTDIGHMIREIESSDFLGKLRLARARKNPWLDMLGQGLKGAGQALGGSMGGGGGGGSAPIGQSASANFDPSIYG